MTEREFVENVNTIEDIMEVCNEIGVDICEGIFTEESRDEYVTSNLVDLCNNSWPWKTVRDELNSISEDFDYYELIDYDWVGVDGQRTRELFESLYEHMRDNELFDEEEEIEAVSDDEYDQVPLEDEDISIQDLFAECQSHAIVKSTTETARYHVDIMW